ncbi:hypothetical protein [Halegenticoccus tardaugens]|uniref:hypothetical protein n=1 Tax=Halegenticoccus tardaugens TaxID=2071624 RepID=UPI00100BA0FA|nr:hypothetical protein [Halegenticoccus tardaugens]
MTDDASADALLETETGRVCERTCIEMDELFADVAYDMGFLPDSLTIEDMSADGTRLYIEYSGKKFE